ncbi:pro-epidermal growth factor-like isoform X2 [Varroa destructor]|uniref:EGF-like domain-containing protein n=1 Tax=Varroa destructor TaxID=109461 RepID=A0A7M7K9Z0_VARDE|nr:pro-epidermal growth factor-like isoform X2 [Varroa destructor]
MTGAVTWPLAMGEFEAAYRQKEGPLVDKDCASDTVCVNQFPNLGKKCVGQIRCQKGTRQVGIHCIDMDECEEGTHTCLDDQHCKNTFGSYECICKSAGFKLNESTRECDDINECLDESLCDPPGVCRNTRGGYNCSCPEHHIRVPKVPKLPEKGFFCSKTDYCANVTCEGPLRCQNDGYGNSSCICPETTHEMLNGTCIDRDECSGPNLCQRIIGGSVCKNQNGSYACIASPSCNNDGPVVKVNQDGILEVEVHCPQNRSSEANTRRPKETCVKGVCFCVMGYIFVNDSVGCVDIDECAMNQSDCPKELQCKNTDGGFDCVCPIGYRERALQPVNTMTPYYDTIECVDIDECLLDLHTCAFKCRNTVGSYECICKAGYISDITKKVCLPLGGSSVLVVSMFGRFHLAEIDFETDDLNFVEQKMRCEVGVSTIFTYHQTQDQAYFVSEDHRSIYRGLLNESCTRIISDRNDISTLELDWVYGKVYWAESKGIMVSEMNGQYIKIILGFEAVISNMIVNPFNGWLLFTSEGRLWRVGLDGTHMSRIFEETNVTSLAFDVEESNIAIQTDTKLMLCPEDFTDSQGCNDLAYAYGVANSTLTLVDMFVDFALLEDDENTLTMISRNGKHIRRLAGNHTTFKSLRGRVLHTMKQPVGGHKCRMQCSHLCVNSPSAGRYSCLCPDFGLREGTAGCTEIISHEFCQTESAMFSVALFVAGLATFVIGALCVTYNMYVNYGKGTIKSRRGKTFSVSSRNSSTADTQIMCFSIHDSLESELDGRQFVKHETPSDIVGNQHDQSVCLQGFVSS